MKQGSQSDIGKKNSHGFKRVGERRGGSHQWGSVARCLGQMPSILLQGDNNQLPLLQGDTAHTKGLFINDVITWGGGGGGLDTPQKWWRHLVMTWWQGGGGGSGYPPKVMTSFMNSPLAEKIRIRICIRSTHVILAPIIPHDLLQSLFWCSECTNAKI